MPGASPARDTNVPLLQRCPTCRGPVSPRFHVLRIAGDLILDCPTCWTTTVFDRTGRVIRPARS